MDEIMLPVELMKLGYVFIPMIAMVFLMEILTDNSVVKAVIILLKAVAYSALALAMWKFYQGKEQIDIISVFTFIFCCFEALDNWVSLISIPINMHRQAKQNLEREMEKIQTLRR